MRQRFGIILALVLAAVLVNDVSRIAATNFALDSLVVTAGDAAAVAVRSADDWDEYTGFMGAAQALASDEATIAAYSHREDRIYIRIEGPVEDAILISPITSLWSGGRWDEPMVVGKEYDRPI